MLPDRVSNPGPLTYESGALPIALRGPAHLECRRHDGSGISRKEEGMRGGFLLSYGGPGIPRKKNWEIMVREKRF